MRGWARPPIRARRRLGPRAVSSPVLQARRTMSSSRKKKRRLYKSAPTVPGDSPTSTRRTTRERNKDVCRAPLKSRIRAACGGPGTRASNWADQDRRRREAAIEAALRKNLVSASSVLSPSIRGRSFPAADVQCHQRVELCSLHHLVDLDLFVSRADAPAARADLDGRDPELVVDVGIGPDAGAVGRLRLDPLAEQVPVGLLRRLHQRLDVLALVAKQRLVDVHIVVEDGRV